MNICITTGLVRCPLVNRRFIRARGGSHCHLPGLLREREQSLHGLQIRFILFKHEELLLLIENWCDPHLPFPIPPARPPVLGHSNKPSSAAKGYLDT